MARGIKDRIGEGHIELWTVSRQQWRTHLRDQLLPQQLPVAFERILELQQASLPEQTIRRPLRLVERAARGGDRSIDVGRRRVCHLTDSRLGRRIDIGIAAVVGSGAQLAVDQQPRLAELAVRT